nr:polymorphic toxin type 33 domain-containing protein [Pedobacter sp. ASV2]
MMMASSDDRNPSQDKKLTPNDISNLQRQGWDHREKGDHGGQTDLWKDREGNVYQKPKNGAGPGEPIGYNLNDFSTLHQPGFSWPSIHINPTVLKVGAIIGIGALIIITDGAAIPLLAL